MDMKNIQIALEMYLHEFGRYPDPDVSDCGGWDVGNQSLQLLANRLGVYMPKAPNDPAGTGSCNGYRYYRYPAGNAGCDINKGAFYVLGVSDMETSPNPHPKTPSWSCPGRNWQGEFDWVTGKFENE